MQDIFQDFFVWLLKFLAVSTGLLTAARIWTVRRWRRQQKSAANAPACLPVGSAAQNEPLPWWADAAMAGMARILFLLFFGGLSALWAYNRASWLVWTVGGLGMVASLGLCSLWLRKASQFQLALRAHRQLRDFMELTALWLPASPNLEAALRCAADHQKSLGKSNLWPAGDDSLTKSLDRALSRVSPKLQSQFREFTVDTSVRCHDWQTLADGVQQDLCQRAAGQARRVSRWGKYPLLVGAVPAACLFLVAPLTEWTLNRLTAPPTAMQQKPPLVSETPQLNSPRPQHISPQADETANRE